MYDHTYYVGLVTMDLGTGDFTVVMSTPVDTNIENSDKCTIQSLPLAYPSNMN